MSIKPYYSKTIFLFFFLLYSCDNSGNPSTSGCIDGDACNYNYLADTDDGSCRYFDACNVCGGSGISDDSCDCSGNILDCNGECGGLAKLDECGICDIDPNNNCIKDCLGTWGGTATVDICGVCNGSVSDESDCQSSCDMDCYGLCPDDAGYGAQLDICGVCGGAGIPDSSCDCSGNILDCSGECGGLAMFDECGVCDLDPDNNCIKDCLGIWGGNASIDYCGVCNGTGSSCSGCTDPIASNYDQNATVDDGTCLILGCIDPSAINFNQSATSDDGSCYYDNCDDYDICLSMTNVNINDGTLDIILNSNKKVSGFQFTIIGDWSDSGVDWSGSDEDLTILDSYGGIASEVGFSVSTGNNTIIGFSFSGSSIPAGNHTLLTLSFTNFSSTICINDPVFSNSDGDALSINPMLDCYPLNNTGESSLIIIMDSVSSLEVGDIIYLYDKFGISNHGDCSNQIGKVLVGAGIWSGEQLNISAIGSADLCSFGSVQLSGYISGNEIYIEIEREDVVLSATQIEIKTGQGRFGEIITEISNFSFN